MDVLQADKLDIRTQKKSFFDNINIILLLAYIFCMPFTSGFAFTGTISLPLIFAVLLFILMIRDLMINNRFPNGFLGFDIFTLIFFLTIVATSYLINGKGNNKSTNHTIAYFSSFLLFYVTIKYQLFRNNDKEDTLKRILNILSITTLITAVFANIEFISDNLFGLNLNDFIPRPSEEEKYYQAEVIELFHRSRAFASESGGMTFMMELFMPLVIYYFYFSTLCNWRRSVKNASVFFMATSFIFAASTASFIIVPASFLLSSIFYYKSVIKYFKKNKLKITLFATLITLIIAVLNYFFSLFFLIILSIQDKFDSYSFDDRKDRIDFFYQHFTHADFIHKTIGIGPAGFHLLGYDDSRSILSLYFNTIFEIGYTGFMLLTLLLVFILARIFQIKEKVGFFLLASATSGMMHYYIFQSYWVPWFWFICVFSLFLFHHKTVSKNRSTPNA